MVLGLAALLGAACAPAPAAPGSASGGEIRILAGMPSSFDPARHGDLASATYVAQLFETLTVVDAGLVVRPALAESWEVTDAGRRVTFLLREGLAFSDGTPLRAADVVRSWRRLLDPDAPSPLASLMADVRGVRDALAGTGSADGAGFAADGDRRVVVDLERGGGDLPAIVSSAPFAVVPPGAGFEIAPEPRGWVGSGAYVLEAVEEDAVVLAANPRHWAGAPAIATVRMVTGLAGRSPVEAFADGDLDYTEVSHLDAGWLAYDPDLGPALRRTDALSVTYYGFDTTAPPFDDPRLRRAVGMAVDWRRLAALDEPGSSVIASSLVPPGLPGVPDGDWLPPYDPAAARALLAEAGHPGGRGLGPVELRTPGGPYDAAVVAMLRDNLGLEVDLVTMDFGAYAARLDRDAPPIWALSWIADYPGANDFLGVLLGTGSTANAGGWSDAAFDRAVADATAAASATAARAAWAVALGRIRDEVPVVPVAHGVSWALARDGLLGAVDGGQGIVRLAGLAWAP